MAEALFAALALLGLTLAATALLATWLRLPAAIGYLVGGIALGTVLRRADLGLVPQGPLDSLAEVGVLLLLFLIGLELDLQRLRTSLRETAWAMPFDIAVPAAAVAVLTTLAGWELDQALAAGMALAISSTIFGDRITRSPQVAGPARRRVLGVLISEDMVVGLLLALIVVLAGGGGSVIGVLVPVIKLLFFLVLLMVAAQIIVPRVLDRMAARHLHELVLLWAMGLVALFGYLGHLAGSAELGALVAGVAAAEAGSRYVVRNSLAGMRDLALAVFFFAFGMVVVPGDVLAMAPLAFGVALVFLVAKMTVHTTASAAAGLDLRQALHTGVGLATVGEFSLILVAVAEKEGVAHPDLRTLVVGAVILLLPIAAALQKAVPAMERGYGRLPRHFRRTMQWAASGLRRKQSVTAQEQLGRRRALRLLVTNLLLLAALGIGALELGRRIQDDLIALAPFWGPTLYLGAVLTAALPLLLAGYRAYRELVHRLVGLRPGERVGAGRTRARLVDAWVSGTAFLALVFVALSVPEALPVVVGAGLVAFILATLAWRQLHSFHDTLESTLTRVLGEEQDEGGLLDEVLRKYPWGVRFAAVPVPRNSPVAGRTVRGSRIAELTGAMVAVVQRRGQEIVNPNPDEVLREGDTLVLLGDVHQIDRAEALVVSHGEALRLEAESRSATVEEVQVAPESAWVGVNLEQAMLRETTGTLLLGILHGSGARPRGYDPEIVLRAGDRLILLGTPLQLERARRVAAGERAPEQAAIDTL